MRKLDLAAWPRRQHFEMFRGFENPFFNVCAPVDVTELHAASREPGGPSFFLATIFLSLRAANAVEELHYRLSGDGVIVHEVVHGGSTILRPDETFGFAYFRYQEDYRRFAEEARGQVEAVRAGSELSPRSDLDDLIHYSVLPWVSFTSFAHARRLDASDSVPKVVFGKHFEDGGRRKMPVSVEVHHALADGLHTGRFFERFQAGLDGARSLGA